MPNRLKLFWQDLRENLNQPKAVAVLSELVLLAVVLNAAVFILYELTISRNPVSFTLETFQDVGFLARVFMVPLGGAFTIAVCLLLEAWRLGYEKSSLRRLLRFRDDESSREDLFYLCLGLTSASNLLAFFMSFGLGYMIHAQIVNHLGTDLLAGTNYAVQGVCMLLLGSLVFYWHHRLMHSGSLWEVHRVHHAATELNIVTPFRNHPIDRAIDAPLKAAPAAILGISPEVVLVYAIANGFYQCLVHSDWDWGRGWFGRYVLINPSRHRLHHAADERFWSVNFGILTIWDRLFGTFQDLPEEDVLNLPVGVADHPRHNQGTPWRNVYLIYFDFLRHLVHALLPSRQHREIPETSHTHHE